MELEHKRSRLRFFLVSLYLRFDFRVCIFLLFVILAGPPCDVAFSDYCESILLMLVLAHSKFPQN